MSGRGGGGAASVCGDLGLRRGQSDPPDNEFDGGSDVIRGVVVRNNKKLGISFISRFLIVLK